MYYQQHHQASHPSTRTNIQDVNTSYFQIRHTARLCIALIYGIQFIHRLIGAIWDSTMTGTSGLIFIISVPFCFVITLLILVEHLIYKKKGTITRRWSNFIDFALLLLFLADWVLILLSNLARVQQTNPPSWKISTLYGFTAFAWRTLLLTLIVQRWYLKMIIPIIAVAISTAYTIHYNPHDLGFFISRAIIQLFNVILIVYCEDKLKWKMIWINLQQEKWVQVNHFILNNIPENIMILDLGGKVKFISNYCKSFMENCHLSLENKDFYNKIRDLQQQYEPNPPYPSTVCLQMDRLTTGNELLGEENNPEDFLKIETLEYLIMNFQKIITSKNLPERQFLVYNGKLKIENHQERSLEVKISFVQNFGNDHIILIFRDTTQRDLLLTLEETNKYKDQLLASVSHELRAPLNGNINLVESAVNSPKIPQEIKESLLIPALRSSKFLLHIINDILDMSQIKEKKLRLIYEAGNLKETLKSTVQLVEFQAKMKGVELKVELDPGLPKSFCTDHLRLSQIVLNLLTNATKFTKEGAIKLTARPMNNHQGWVKITVEDSGIGISKENLNKLFSSYTNIEFEGKQQMNPAGIGLGLNIASNLVRMLSPKCQSGIRVTSVPGQGSVFSFVLEDKAIAKLSTMPSEEPSAVEKQSHSLDIADELPDAVEPKLHQKISKANTLPSMNPFISYPLESEPLATSCSCSKILIVDDNPFNTMAFETILRSLEIKCDSVYSGKAAIQKLLSRKACGWKDCKSYVVIFMDQEMPEMNGSETVIEIKRLQKEGLIRNGVKFIGCTAHKAKEEVDGFLASGLDSCIHKPISINMIKETLRGADFYKY